MAITESGITLNFPDNKHFRFKDCQGYKDIQQNFREMDVCWYDQKNDILYIIELKDWGDGILEEEKDGATSPEDIKKLKRNITNYRISVLFKKSLDSTCMFISMLLNKPYSVNIKGCSPFTITNDTKIQLLSIINWTNLDTTYISNIHSEYKKLLKPYATLFAINSFVVLTKDQAVKKFGWVENI